MLKDVEDTRAPREQITQIRRMRAISCVEGATLVVLVGVAVPLKHLASLPMATAIMGPIHGVAFMLYAWMLSQTLYAFEWSRSETIWMVVAAFIPFGGFVSERVLARRQNALVGS